jgi:predicted DNA-binding protein
MKKNTRTISTLICACLFFSTAVFAKKQPPGMKILPLTLPSVEVQSAAGFHREGQTLEEHKDWAKELERTHEKIWVDLYPSIEFEFTESEKDLKDAIEVYQKIAKTDPKLVPLRRRMLIKISELCHAHLKGEGAPSASQLKLEFIAKISQNKADYLEAILKIKDQTHKMAFRMQKTGTPIRTMDSHLFGRELLEHLDPAVRGRDVLNSYFERWHELATQGHPVPDFFFWLEGENLTLNRDLKSEDEDMASTATRIVSFEPDGLAHSKFHMTRPKGTYSKEMIEKYSQENSDPIYFDNFLERLEPQQETEKLHYAIDEHGKLFIRSHSPYHSYVLRGQNVISAGFISFKGGKIEYLDNESGHYTPHDSSLDFAKKLLTEQNGEKILSDTFSMHYRQKAQTREPESIKKAPQPKTKAQ